MLISLIYSAIYFEKFEILFVIFVILFGRRKSTGRARFQSKKTAPREPDDEASGALCCLKGVLSEEFCLLAENVAEKVVGKA